VKKLTIAEAIREAIREEMRRDRKVFCIGEDIGVSRKRLQLKEAPQPLRT